MTTVLRHPPALTGRKRVLPLLRSLGTNGSSKDGRQELLDYISSGPLLEACGLTREAVQAELDLWLRLGHLLAANLRFDHDRLDDVQRLRIYRYYLPIFFWARQQREEQRRRDGGSRPLVLGMSAPQGCGKTTIVEQLEALFAEVGCRAASVSIDDFYLTYADQQALAKANPGNSLLELRGNAGSHDMALGRATLAALAGAGAQDSRVQVPRYDKSANQGRGDRAPQAAWPTVTGPLDVVLFEGWMLGFGSVPSTEAAAASPHFVTVNEKLAEYKEAWDSFVDAWLVVQVEDPKHVYKWRLQAEEQMRASGRPGMTDEQVADFVDRYMPAYRACLPGLYARGPTTAVPGRTLTVAIDQSRAPLARQPKQLAADTPAIAAR